MNNEMETMEVVNDNEICNEGSGKVIAAVVAGVGLAAGAVALGVKKLKAKNGRPKKKLKWVYDIEDDINVEDIEDTEM